MPSFFRRAGAQILNYLTSAADPGGTAGQLKAYIKAVGGVTQLFTQNSAGTVFQMTPPGIVGGTVISPAALGAGTTNNYAPAGLDSATMIRQNMTGTNTLTGLDATTAGGAGRRITIVNIGTTIANQLIIANENTNSTAANRFSMPGAADFPLPPNAAVTFEYDSTSTRWRPIGISTNWMPDVTITPTAIAANQNNYNPTGLAGANIIRIGYGSGFVITGLVAQPSGTRVIFQSIRSPASPEYLEFASESASSTAANRFTMPINNSWWLPPSSSICFRYDGTTSRWVAESMWSNSFPVFSSNGNPGVTVGYPVENIGLSRNSSQVFAIQAGADAKQLISAGSPGTNAMTSNAILDVQSQHRWSSTVAYGPITGAQNNFAITTVTMNARFTTGGAASLTGMTGGASGRTLTIWNPSANTITLNSEDAGSTAANRFLLSAATVAIPPEGALLLIYDGTSSRWRVLSL